MRILIRSAGAALAASLALIGSAASAGDSPAAGAPAGSPGQPSTRQHCAPSGVAISDTLELESVPLWALSTEAQVFLNSREGDSAVAVILPGARRIYVSNGRQRMPLASITKVAIMATVMDRAQTEGRPLTDDEAALLEAMITISDNDSASLLWEAVGRGEGVRSYLSSVGIRGIRPEATLDWGDTPGSATAVAQLFAKLAFGVALDEPLRAFAMQLLAEVADDQRWGVASAVDPASGAVLEMKDGWYPTESGWIVNSAGAFLSPEGVPEMVIVVLTRDQPSFEYGVATVEGVATRIRGAIDSPAPPGSRLVGLAPAAAVRMVAAVIAAPLAEPDPAEPDAEAPAELEADQE